MSAGRLTRLVGLGCRRGRGSASIFGQIACRSLAIGVQRSASLPNGEALRNKRQHPRRDLSVSSFYAVRSVNAAVAMSHVLPAVLKAA